jgi:hypothetical protein
MFVCIDKMLTQKMAPIEKQAGLFIAVVVIIGLDV